MRIALPQRKVVKTRTPTEYDLYRAGCCAGIEIRHLSHNDRLG